MTDHPIQPLLVAACGNTLAGDDAFGPLVARELLKRKIEGVEVLDLGMRPAALLDHIPRRRAVILVDAAVLPPDAGAAGGQSVGQLLDVDFFAPGRPLLCADHITSTHGLSLAGQLELAQTLSMLPPIVRLVALIVEEPRIGTPGVTARRSIAPAEALILRRLQSLA